MDASDLWRMKIPAFLLACLVLLGLSPLAFAGTGEDPEQPQKAAEALPAAPKKIEIQHVEPPNWWVGMQDPRLLVLVYGEGIGKTVPEFEHPGVQLVQYHEAWISPNYLFLDLTVAPDAEPGTFRITFRQEGKKRAVMDYTLLTREDRSGPGKGHDGFDNADAICLITPDRFANGDPTNDVVEGMAETGLDRSDKLARHGGDIKGMIGMLDYLQDLGYTTLWPSPLLTNDMAKYSYHGYAITNYYGVDPRFGTLADYKALADSLHARGMKLIQDQVANHCGSNHYWVADPPFARWFNHQEAWQSTNHQHTTLIDPYATQVDIDGFNQGWFVETMPDLHQRHPFMSRYLIQNSIWWIETLGLDGIRQDTWGYIDPDFLDVWTCAITRQYPDFSIVGEEWVDNPLMIAAQQQGFGDNEGCLEHVMDFYQSNRLRECLTEDESWNSGWIKLYQGMAYDGLYPDPMAMLVFGDNHDMDRIHTAVGEDFDLTKMALAWVAVVRGIPQVYYGTEIAMSNAGHPGDHGIIRTDFPGGWEGDPVNAVTGEGLSPQQADLQAWFRSLMNWRKSRSVVHEGNLRHWTPKDGVYSLARIGGGEAVLLLMNKSDKDVSLDWARYEQVLKERRKGTHALTGEALVMDESLVVPARGMLLIDVEPRNPGPEEAPRDDSDY
jgi:glycosidase